MSEHTTEDFGKARFAESPEGRVAMRHSGRWSLESKFAAATMTGLSDEDMAVAGWRPVHEHNPHATDALEEEIQDLRDRIRERDAKLEVLWRQGERQEGTIAALRDFPLTRDSLREAWENAEVPTEANPIREGDLVIYAAYGGFYVGRAEGDAAEMNAKNKRMHRSFRILHRAPRREPWQALADEMEELYDGYSLRAAEAAQFLHERGVRLVGGDDRG